MCLFNVSYGRGRTVWALSTQKQFRWLVPSTSFC